MNKISNKKIIQKFKLQPSLYKLENKITTFHPAFLAMYTA